MINRLLTGNIRQDHAHFILHVQSYLKFQASRGDALFRSTMTKAMRIRCDASRRRTANTVSGNGDSIIRGIGDGTRGNGDGKHNIHVHVGLHGNKNHFAEHAEVGAVMSLAGTVRGRILIQVNGAGTDTDAGQRGGDGYHFAILVALRCNCSFLL